MLVAYYVPADSGDPGVKDLRVKLFGSATAPQDSREDHLGNELAGDAAGQARPQGTAPMLVKGDADSCDEAGGICP